METITQMLYCLADPAYKAFQTKLMPTVDPATVLGVRTPDLRRLAKQLRSTPLAREWMNTLPHATYEEANLHGYLIEYINDFDQAVQELERWLPYVNNWATCDSVAPPVLATDLPKLEQQIRIWLTSPHLYTVRYAIGMLQRHFLEDAFDPIYLEWVASVPTEDYYLHMMVAWYFATALAKQPNAALPFLQERRLPIKTHNKIIQKAVESRRISPQFKTQLRALRRQAKGTP